jgi:hypothetical protein
MGAGEYVSVRSQRELLDASTPDPQAGAALPQLDVNANELALVYRARGMSESEAAAYAAEALADHTLGLAGRSGATDIGSDAHVAVGTGLRAALSSFCFFASGALVPVLPYLFGLQGTTALVVAIGSGRDRATGYQCDRRPLVWRTAVAASAAPTAHRLWRRRSYLRIGPVVWRRALLIFACTPRL